MKAHKIIILCLILLSISCSSSINFKSVAEGDLRQYLGRTPQASDHPGAGACLLHSYAYVEFFQDGTSVKRHLERYKIFNERGRKYASKSFSYRLNEHKARVLFANTITPDGRVIPLQENAIQDTEQFSGFDFYTDIRLKRFTMPAVEDGCIVEYATEVRQNKTATDPDFFTIFLCRNFDPIVEDILEVVLPRGRTLKYKSFQTDLAPQIITEGDKTRYIFKNLNQEAILPESRMPSLVDRETFPQVWIWTLEDWSGISRWYAKLIRQQMKADRELQDFTLQLIAGMNSREEKINAIFKFVSQNTRYVAVLLGAHTHKPHAASEVFQKRYGDCKDKTVLLITMLEIAGIEAQPALVPVHREYFDETMPSLAAFNHMIAVVPEKDKFFWLDATNEVAAYNSPPSVRPVSVFIIRPDGTYKFVKTPAPDEKSDRLHSELTYRIDEQGNAYGDFRYEYHGLAAQTIRYLYKYMSPRQRQKSFEDRGIEVENLETDHLDNTNKPFFVHVRGRIKNLAQLLDSDTIVLSNLFRYDTYRDVLAAPFRKYPIVLRPSFHTEETLRFVFPPGFQIKKLPPPFTYDDGAYRRTEIFKEKGSEIEVSVQNIRYEKKILPLYIDDFKKEASILQARDTAVKSIVMERK
jgi:hypothetical protein